MPTPVPVAESDCQAPDLFQDVHEQVESLIAGLSWADIIEREEQEEANCAATPVTSAVEPQHHQR